MHIHIHLFQITLSRSKQQPSSQDRNECWFCVGKLFKSDLFSMERSVICKQARGNVHILLISPCKNNCDLNNCQHITSIHFGLGFRCICSTCHTQRFSEDPGNSWFFYQFHDSVSILIFPGVSLRNHCTQLVVNHITKVSYWLMALIKCT